MKSLAGFTDLLFPPRCLGCGSLNSGLCPFCALSWRFQKAHRLIGNFSVFSAVQYSPIARNILLAAKEDGIGEADELLIAALRFAFQQVIFSNSEPPFLVPIPSSKSAIRHRGRNFLTVITAQLSNFEQVPLKELLSHSRKVRDQSNLEAKRRMENLAGSMQVSRGLGRGRSVLLVDDLLTSGATLREAGSALSQAGFRVHAAITACVAQPLR